MASAQIAGTYKIYIENPNGARRLQKSAGSYWWGPGGSSDGTVANTPEKWNYLAPCMDVGGPGYKIVVTLTAGSAATSDASDGFWSIPVAVGSSATNQTPQMIGNPAHATGLGNDNFTTTLTPGDNAYVASVETPVAVIRANEGVYFRLGGDRVFMSIENNA